MTKVRPWTEDIARAVCDAFLARYGMSGAHPKPISFRQNAIYRVPGPDISVRIYGPGEDQSRAALMVRCARWLERRGFPAVRLSPIEADQPFDLLGYKISVWRWIEQERPNADPAFTFGRLLRSLHDLPMDDAPAVPRFDQFSRIRQRLLRIRAAGIVPPDVQALLAEMFDRAAAMDISSRDTRLGNRILHGDAMPGNAIQTADEMMMIDLDSVCSGPCEWDLVPMYVIAKRFARDGPRRWHSFLAGYGITGQELPDLQAASLIKQLSMTVYLCLSAGQSPDIDAEIVRRMKMWEDGDEDGRWTTGFTVAVPG